MEEGRGEQKEIEVTYTNPDRPRRVDARWKYERAYPVKYQTLFLNGRMLEIVELTFEDWERR